MSMTDNAANIGLANQSLGLLGSSAITVGSTTEQNYVYCALFFDDARDEILTAHKWNFAKKRAYAIQTTDPLFGYDNAFTKPSGCLKVCQIEEAADTKFEVENALILTDEGSSPADYDDDGVDYLAGEYISSDTSGSDLTYLVDTAFTSSDETTDIASYCTSQGDDLEILKVEYIYQVTDVSTYPVSVYQCVVINLARMLSSPIKQSEEVSMNLQAMLYGSRNIVGYLDLARSFDAQEGGAVAFTTNTWIESRR